MLMIHCNVSLWLVWCQDQFSKLNSPEKIKSFSLSLFAIAIPWLDGVTIRVLKMMEIVESCEEKIKFIVEELFCWQIFVKDWKRFWSVSELFLVQDGKIQGNLRLKSFVSLIQQVLSFFSMKHEIIFSKETRCIYQCNLLKSLSGNESFLKVLCL